MKNYKVKVGTVCCFPSHKEILFTVIKTYKLGSLKYVDIVGFVENSHMVEIPELRQGCLIYLPEVV